MDRSRRSGNPFRNSRLVAAAGTFWIVIACGFSPPTGLTEIAITFEAPEELWSQTKTLTPNVPLDIAEFTVIGKGPETGAGRAKFEITTAESSYVIESILLGAWEIGVFGYNAGGELLALGSSDVDLNQEAVVTVEMNFVEGSGDLVLSVVLSESVPTGIDVRATATARDGTSIALDVGLVSAGTYSLTGSLDAGFYTVEVVLVDAGGNEVSGGIEIAYLLSGHTTIGVMELVTPQAPAGSLTLVLESDLPESALLILGADVPLFVGPLVSGRLEASSSGSLGERGTLWYVNGVAARPEESLDQKLSRRFDAAGLFRIDAVLTRAGAALASDSAILEVIDPIAYGPLAYVSTLRDNNDRVDGISGARAIALHPDGADLYVRLPEKAK